MAPGFRSIRIAGSVAGTSRSKKRPQRPGKPHKEPPGTSRSHYSRGGDRDRDAGDRSGADRARTAPAHLSRADRYSMDADPVIHKGTSNVPEWALRLPSPHVVAPEHVFLDAQRGLLGLDRDAVVRPKTSGAPQLATLDRFPAPDDFGVYTAPPTARSVASTSNHSHFSRLSFNSAHSLRTSSSRSSRRSRPSKGDLRRRELNAVATKPHTGHPHKTTRMISRSLGDIII